MSFSDYLENKLLDHMFGGTVYSPLANLYIGLSTADPLDDGSGITEPVGGSYARVTKVNNLTNWPAAVAGAKANGTVITFPTATASWGTVGWLIIMDDPSAGNFLGGVALSASKTIDNGDTSSFAVGDLDITLD